MPVICIGPICIPWAAIPPVVFFLGKPIWAILPESAKEKLITFWDWLGELISPIAAYIPFMKNVDQHKKNDDVQPPTPTAHGAFWTGGEVLEVPTLIEMHPFTVENIESEFHLNELLSEHAEQKVILQCTAAWCAPCQALKGVVNQAAKTHPDVIFARIDVDDVPEVAENFDITKLPEIMVFKGTKVFGRFTGSGLEEQIHKMAILNIGKVGLV